ncbi:MAG: chromosomal replication initiator protein DnaA, partial [Kiritimatiellia bacterium]|nr:chromosomal replication initiator protein DnaA [Kiritimatiellia bacterium]
MTTKVDIIWHKVSQLLKQQLNSDVFARWIAVIAPNRIAENTLVLNVSNNFYQSWLEENYLTLIKAAVNTVCAQEMKVVFEVTTNHKTAQSEEVKPTTADLRPVHQKKQIKTNANENSLNPKYIFASFVVGSSNSFAHASSLAVAQAPGKAYNPLFIYGGVGLGKTHLMQAIGHYVFEKSRLRTSYLSCEALMNDFIDALRTTRIKQFRDKYRGTDLLLIDDIHFLTGKSGLQEEFFHTFNVLFDAHKQIVMTSDRPAADIAGLEERLVSRFEWGLVTELTQPDFETRVAILRSKQQSMNIALQEDVLGFIASNIKANIRRLEGALIRLVSYASLYNKPINISLAEQLLRDSIEQETKDPVSISTIQKNTADFFDIRLADMTSAHRTQNIALPRQIAMYLCRQLTNS